MKCKICHHDNLEVHYILKNSKVFKCAKCNFHYSDYLDKEISEEYDNEEVTDEIRSYLRHQLQSNEERFEQHVRISLEGLNGIPQPKILDVGCGGGLYLSKIRDKAGAECYGIELNMRRLRFAKDEYRLNNIYALPIQSEFWLDEHEGSFDLITLWDVIEHVNSPREVFDAASKLLKDDGLLIMDTPCRDTFYHKFGEYTYRLSKGTAPTFLNIMYSNHSYGHKQIFSKKDLLRLYKEHSFGVSDVSVFHELSFPTKYYLNKMVKNESIVNVLDPFVTAMLRVFQIKNKMLVVGKKEAVTIQHTNKEETPKVRHVLREL